MELLKIESEQGFLLLGDRSVVVSQVTAEDISAALELILTNDEIEIPEAVDSSTIVNPAQKIIFEQLFASFREVFASRDALNDGIDEVFAAAEEKYFGLQSESEG